MSAQRRIFTTAQFLDPFLHILWLIAGVMFAAMLVGSFWGRTLLATTVQVEPDEPKTLSPVEIKPQAIGAFRADVKAVVPSNQWVTYEIQLQDAQGNVLASGIKQAWAESGTWYEDGESGTWYEDDVMSGLDVRTAKPEAVVIALNVLEYTDISGQEIDQPVTFNITVKEGMVDTRYLSAGLVGTGLLAIAALFSFANSGTLVIRRKIDDSDVGGRAILGGSKQLVRVYVDIKSDEYSPESLTVLLTINNGHGTEIYRDRHLVRLRRLKTDKGKVTSGKGRLCKFFVLEPRDSYKFYAEVTPDRSVDQTMIQVRDGSRTIWPVQVISIQSPT